MRGDIGDFGMAFRTPGEGVFPSNDFFVQFLPLSPDLRKKNVFVSNLKEVFVGGGWLPSGT